MSCSVCQYLALLIVVGVILYLSKTTRYYTKFTVFMLSTSIFSMTLPIPFFIIRPRDYRNALMPAWSCRFILRLLGVTYEVKGLANINKTKGGIVLMNHQSALDLAVLAYLWPVIGRATVVAKRELLYAFPFGQASYLWGTLFINRSNKKDAFDKLNQESEAITATGAKLLVFPEGTRSQVDTLLPFKKGAFHIAVQSQSCIQPVVISKYWFLNSEDKSFGRGHCIIDVLPEISCKGMTKDDIPDLVVRVQDLMQQRFELLNLQTACADAPKKRD